MKRSIIVVAAAGILLLAGITAFWNNSRSVPVPENSISISDEAEQAAVPTESGRLSQVSGQSVVDHAKPVRQQEITDAVCPFKTFKPGEILDETVRALSGESFLRRRLVRAGGKYPRQLFKETVRRTDSGKYQVVSQVGMVADQIVVKLAANATEEDLQELAARHGASVAHKLALPRNYVLQLSSADVESVDEALRLFGQETEVISRVQPNHLYFSALDPSDSKWSQLWGMETIKAPSAWDTETGDDSVLVAVIDTGIDASHEDLAGNMWVNSGEIGTDSDGKDKKTNGLDDDNNGYVDDWQGWDFYNDDNDPSDDNSHGTHVAGTIGAVGNNSRGVAGVCWDISLVGIKILGAEGYGASDTEIVNGILYASDLGARVENNSWGGYGSSDVLEEAINAINSNKVLFVAAAGNYNDDNDVNPFYPASYSASNIISVAATDENDALASFSHYGATSVDLAAPGVGILSTIPDDSYESLDGTSMAAPHVAGAAALLWSANSSLDYMDVKTALLNSVDKISSLNGKMVSGGRLNVFTLMTAAADVDGDGMPDDWELQYSPPLYTNIVDSANDPDNDHLANIDEYMNGTDPTDSDTDDDSLVDGWEVTYGFSPLSTTGQLDSVERVGFSTGDEAMDVVVVGDYAYVADGSAGLMIIDVSDPANPSKAASLDTDGNATGVAVSNGVACVADGTNGLVVVDVSDPQNPQQLAVYEIDGTAAKVVIDSNYAFVACWDNYGDGMLYIVDITVPSSPSFTGEYSHDKWFYDVYVNGASAYIVNGNNQIERINISNPAAPTLVKAQSIGTTKTPGVYGINGNGTRIFVASADQAISTFDMNLNWVSSDPGISTKGMPADVRGSDGFVYVAEGSRGLEVFDITDLANPVQFVQYSTYGGGNAVFVKGDHIYLADGTSGLQIFGVSYDVDSDGMLDSWEEEYFGSATNTLPFDDSDGDGISNWGEYLAGLNPTNSDQDADGLIDGTDEVQVYNTDPRTVDTDKDGLVDGSDGKVPVSVYTNLYADIAFADANTNGFIDGELDFGTDPLNSDSDDDGMPDGWEVKNGLNPLVDDHLGDPDGDGVSNEDEYSNGTEPQSSDTDGDGMPDGWEIDNGLNPIADDSLADPDGDGLFNLYEYSLASNTLWAAVYTSVAGAPASFSFGMPGFTDPNDADSDDDGLNDFFEIITNAVDNFYITNPNDADTDDDGFSDGWEDSNGWNPVVIEDPNNTDRDYDGLKDVKEVELGTDPINPLDPIWVDDDAPGDVAVDGGEKNSSISDPNEDGSMAHPFDSIQEAITNAMDGITVLVTNGLYFGTGNYDIGSGDKSLIVRSWDGPSNTVINCQELGSGFVLTNNVGTNTLIYGFTITESGEYPSILVDGVSARIENCRLLNSAESGIEISSGASPVITSCQIEQVGVGILSASSSGVTVENTVISNCAGRGIWIQSDASPVIYGSTVSGCTGGIRLSGGDGLIERCTISGNTLTNAADPNGAGVRLENGSSPYMINLLVTGNEAFSGSGMGGGLYVGANSYPNMINCTVADNFAAAGGGLASSGRPTIRNTIIWTNIATQTDSSIYREADTPIVSYSCIEGGYKNMLLGAVTNNPQFVGAGNYRLSSSNSPCFNAGTSYMAPTNDLDGVIRPAAGAIDIGCYEYGGTSSVDSDGDGMPDWWENAYNLNPAVDDSGGDADSDGLSNSEEYQLGTNPRDNDTDNDGMPDDWEVDNSLDPLLNDAALDPDGDNAGNLQEYLNETNPQMYNSRYADTDGDGMPDEWEALYSPPLDTNVVDSALDPDNDNLTNIEEYQNGTDPTNPDSDNDTLNDGDEVLVYGTNPNKKNSDDDDLDDYEEVITFGTDPNNPNDPVFVDDDGPNDWVPFDPEYSDTNENGRIDHPFDSIQEAIDVATNGMTVLVTNGTYEGIGNWGLTPNGKAITIRSWNSNEVTTILAHGYGSAFILNNSETTNTVIQGFTIETQGDLAPEEGIVVDGSSPVIRDCVIHNCELEAISCLNGAAPQIINCEFYDVPFGIYADGSDGVLIQESFIHDTYISSDSTLYGRGIYIADDAAAEITWTTVSNCPGGIALDNSDASIRQCIIRDNNAPNYLTVDGKFYFRYGFRDLDNEDEAELTDDDENGAGILLLNGSSPLIRNCLIAGNKTWAEDPDYSENAIEPAYGLGGGIYIGTDCNPTGVNCTVVGNHAMTRGGSVSSSGRPVFRNMIFWGNTSSNAAIAEITTTTTTVTTNSTTQISGDPPVTNTVVTIITNFVETTATERSVSSEPDFNNIYIDDEVIDIWYCDIEYGYDNAVLCFTADPQFVGSDYLLAAGSPCTNAGTYYLASSIDLVGNLRPGVEDFPTRVDLGCYQISGGLGVATNPIALGASVGSTSIATSDTDGDGYADDVEVALGTDRYDISDFFHISHDQSLEGGTAMVVWPTQVGCYYTVQYTDSLTGGSWADVDGWVEVPGDGSIMTCSDIRTEGSRFYRVLVRIP